MILPFTAIHSKNLVAIVYLLVALAMHFQAPIRLPEHVSVQVVVVKVRHQHSLYAIVCCSSLDSRHYIFHVSFGFEQKREGILQTALVTKELTSTTE